jgi:hypothetical protein
VDRLHVQGIPQDEGDVLFAAEVGDPVPREHAFDADDQPVAKRRDGAQQGLGAARQIAIEEDGAGLVEDAQVHGPGVQVDAAIESVLLRVESHHGLPVRESMRWRVVTSSIPAEQRP